MALNFPDSPTLNQVYTDTTSGFSYQWDGVVWQSYSPAASKNISIVDDVSGSFNGVTDTFALSTYGASLTPANAQQLRVVLGGIVQEPLVDYTVSSGNIIFTTPPAGGLDCSIVSLGPALPQNNVVPVDGSVTEVKLANGSVTPIKLSTGGPSWNSGGDVVITGTGATSLLVNGNARVTGILTIGTSSITLDGTSNEVRIGTAMTISSTGITGSASSVTSSSTAFGLSGIPNVIVGVVTATSVSVSGNVSIAGTLTYEDVTNVDSIGIVTARSGVNVTNGSIVISSGGLSVSGVTTVAAGSTSAPSLSPTGDNNTGIFFPSADTIAFVEGGSESARFNSSGNLGIGTTNPSEKLHVIGNILASGNVTGYSDENLKDNIKTIPNALDKVTQLRGVEYDRKDIEGNPHNIGVIAQEVERIIPEVVKTHEDGIKSVAYGNLVGLLIEAIKELKEEVNELKARLEEV